jgi:hypothetical protein
VEREEAIGHVIEIRRMRDRASFSLPEVEDDVSHPDAIISARLAVVALGTPGYGSGDTCVCRGNGSW